MTRRHLLCGTIAGLAARAAAPPVRTTMGVTIDCYQFGRRRQAACEFAEYCNSIGAGGIQIEVPPDLDYARKFRRYLDNQGMFLDAMVSLPKDDTLAFERQVAAAKEAGAFAMRAACLGGRRYEVFSSIEQWREFVRESHARIARAVPIAEKHKIPLGIENHKDWTVDELAALLKQHSSEYLGVCLDTGNNLALLDDYLEVVERLAPYTVNTHLKDMSLAEYREGILLGEPVFGEGFLDLKRIVSTVRRARPNARVTVEMITRNPLKVPVFTDRYWATFPDRSASYLARTIAVARANPPRHPLPEVERLDRNEHIRLEEANVVQCLTYAANELGMRRPA
jgi:sugar phosphate isomerase/epimerase